MRGFVETRVSLVPSASVHGAKQFATEADRIVATALADSLRAAARGLRQAGRAATSSFCGLWLAGPGRWRRLLVLLFLA